jgi:hypothetical protein
MVNQAQVMPKSCTAGQCHTSSLNAQGDYVQDVSRHRGYPIEKLVKRCGKCAPEAYGDESSSTERNESLLRRQTSTLSTAGRVSISEGFLLHHCMDKKSLSDNNYIANTSTKRLDKMG